MSNRGRGDGVSGGGASEKGQGRGQGKGQGKGVWVCAIRQLATVVGMKPRSFSTKPTGSFSCEYAAGCYNGWGQLLEGGTITHTNTHHSQCITRIFLKPSAIMKFK